MRRDVMRGAWVGRYGGPEVVEIREDLPVPTPGAGEVLVRVEASGVAFADTLMRRGIYPDVPKPPFTLGYDLVGEVVELGSGVTRLRTGQRIAALTTRGANAEYAVAQEARSVVVPEGVDAPPAAAIVSLVLNYVTAHQMLHRVAKVEPGQQVLVWGAAGGVGTALLELAALADVRVVGVALRRPDRARGRAGGHTRGPQRGRRRGRPSRGRPQRRRRHLRRGRPARTSPSPRG